MAAEAYEGWSANIDQLTGYEITGGSRAMFANRLSYFFDFKGKKQAAKIQYHTPAIAVEFIHWLFFY